jgi:hypothetical protein
MIARLGETPPSLAPTETEVNRGLDAVREQVDRILASHTFRAAEVLRHLLRFLADKTFSGEADQLKEYSIGLDALGKPPSYDPSKDAIVRLQASRLRQKLDEYYQNEGRHAAIVISLPKARFKIAWRQMAGETGSDAAVQTAAAPITSAPAEVTPLQESPSARRWRNIAICFAALFLLLTVAGAWSFFRVSRLLSATRVEGPFSAELEELWRPFLSSKHHLIIAFTNPLFVRFQRDGYPDIVYHSKGQNTWEEATGSPEFSALRRSLGDPKAEPTFDVVGRNALVSTLVLSRFFVRRLPDISLAPPTGLSWQQLADNDVILLSDLKLDRGDSALPIKPAFIVDKTGVRNLQPRAGEPAVYPDSQDHQQSDGRGLELVSMLPGPLGRTSIITFYGNHSWGAICGVQAFTDPSFARVLLDKLKTPSGSVPRYYQVLLTISYRDGTPTTASYVNHRVLALK